MKLVVSNRQKDIELVKAATLQFQEQCGAFFKEKRIQQKKTEEEVAELLNLPVEAIRNYESGKEAIPIFHVGSLSDCLKIPPQEIMELHLDLEKKLLPKALFEQHFLQAGRDIGKLVRQARKTVFLSEKTLAQLLTRSGYPISENEIMKIEMGDLEPSVDFWFSFCKLIHLSVDVVHGYSRWEHLAKVNAVIKKGAIRIPTCSKLLNALENYRSAEEANIYKVSYLMRFSLAIQRR